MTRALRKQDGISLIMAIGVLSVLSMTGVTMVSYSTSNMRSAGYSQGNGTAYDLAEAGINEMMAILANPANNALRGHLLPQTTRAYQTGMVTWSGTLNQAAAVWTVSSTGRVKNPTGNIRDVTRTLTAKIPVTSTYTQPLNNPAWNYIFSRQTGSTCDMTLENNVSGSARIYVSGNLCLKNNASITTGSLIVQGNLDLYNNAFIGTPSMAGRTEVFVGGGCHHEKHGVGWAIPCTGNQDGRQIYSKQDPPSYVAGVKNPAPVIAAPVADFAGWYPNAMPGPSMNCTSATGARSGTPPVFDNDTLWNNSVPTVFELTPVSSYTCRVGPAGAATGELSWNASTKTLTVAGTIFIDGSAQVGNDALNQYNGQGTLYLSGSFALLNNARMCGGVSGSECNFAAWNPNTEMLSIVTNGSGGVAGTGNGILVDNNSQFQGALYANANVAFMNNAKSDGPVVGNSVILTNNVVTDAFPTITSVPVGMPGNPQVYAQPNPPQLYSG